MKAAARGKLWLIVTTRNIVLRFALLALLLGTWTPLAAAQAWDFLGRSIDRDTTLVAAREFERFGVSVTITNDLLFVGRRNTSSPSNGGHVEVYIREGTNPPSYRFYTRLSQEDSSFGQGPIVTISARSRSYVLVSAANASGDTGRIYGYERTATGLDPRVVIQLDAPPGAMGSHFGESMAVANDTILVGAPQYSDFAGNRGAAFVFKLRTGDAGIDAFELQDTIFCGPMHASCGFAVDIQNDTAFVSAPGDGLDPDGGRVMQFRVGTGMTPRPEREYKWRDLGAMADTEYTFGQSIAYSGGILYIGDPSASDVHRGGGRIYVVYDSAASPAVIEARNPDEHIGRKLDSQGSGALVATSFGSRFAYGVRLYQHRTDGRSHTFPEVLTIPSMSNNGPLTLSMRVETFSSGGESYELLVGDPEAIRGTTASTGTASHYQVGFRNGEMCMSDPQCVSRRCTRCCSGLCPPPDAGVPSDASVLVDAAAPVIDVPTIIDSAPGLEASAPDGNLPSPDVSTSPDVAETLDSAVPQPDATTIADAGSGSSMDSSTQQDASPAIDSAGGTRPRTPTNCFCHVAAPARTSNAPLLALLVVAIALGALRRDRR